MRAAILAAASAVAIAAAPIAAVAQDQAAAGQGQGVINVTLDFLRDADVYGANGEEIGDVSEIVRSVGERQGLHAVIRVEQGWFEEETYIVKPLEAMTIMGDDDIRLDDVTEDNIQESEQYVEDDWDLIGDEYASYEEAYEANEWDWW